MPPLLVILELSLQYLDELYIVLAYFLKDLFISEETFMYDEFKRREPLTQFGTALREVGDYEVKVAFSKDLMLRECFGDVLGELTCVKNLGAGFTLL